MKKVVYALLLSLSLIVSGVPAGAQSGSLGTNGSISTAGADCSVATRCLVITDLVNVTSIGLYLNVAASGTFNWEASMDGVFWFAIGEDTTAATSATVDGFYAFSNAGYRQFRIRASAISGTATVYLMKGWASIRAGGTVSLTGSLPAGSNLVGRVVVDAQTANGSTTHAAQSAASTNSTNVKASAGQIYALSVINTTATIYYLRLYNLASAPTCSSATGFIESYPVPASTSGAGFVKAIPEGAAYATGIGYCLTGGGTSTDNTNAATGVYISIQYK